MKNSLNFMLWGYDTVAKPSLIQVCNKINQYKNNK